MNYNDLSPKNKIEQMHEMICVCRKSLMWFKFVRLHKLPRHFTVLRT